jgi:hypothetical protein
LAAAGVAGAAAAGFAGVTTGVPAAPSLGVLTSACTEPDGVAFTPPGTAGRSTDASAGGFCSPSGGGGTADLGSSGIAANAQISGWKGNGENVNFYQLEDYGVNEHADNGSSSNDKLRTLNQEPFLRFLRGLSVCVVLNANG